MAARLPYLNRSAGKIGVNRIRFKLRFCNKDSFLFLIIIIVIIIIIIIIIIITIIIIIIIGFI